METVVAQTVQANLDVIWIMIAASLVLFMQAGFTALESGVTRAKNTINVATKNITDFILAVLIFWGVGYAIMFGTTSDGWYGTSGFGLDGLDQPMDYASFVFQATFAGTAATIVSGAVAERIRFIAYAIVSVVITGLIYPVSGHWIWGGGGWLAEMGMVDFAGSTVVHSLGGWVGLAGAWILGARLGRFNDDGTINKIQGHSLVLAVVGVIILWFGWFGFNGGSTLAGDVSVAKIVANTMLAASAGGISCFFLSLLLTGGEVHIEKLLNGVIGGLVGITAGCAVVEPAGAVFVGFSSGVVVYGAEYFLLHVLRIDDPVNAIPAHGFCGAWGTIALAFAAPESALPLGNMWEQLAVQATGAAAVAAWGFGTGAVMFYFLKRSNFLRVPPEGEHKGLNVYEHGASSGLLDTMGVMNNIATAHRGGDGNLTIRVPVEIGSEAGDLAIICNALLDTYHDTVGRMKSSTNDVHLAANAMHVTSQQMASKATQQQHAIDEAVAAISQMAAAIEEVSQSANDAASAASSADEEASQSHLTVGEALETLRVLAEEVDASSAAVQVLDQDAHQIDTILSTIGEIAEQTNLLALNAAIEAARAGEQGRGFAVVADEVRSLATKTHGATEEVRTLLTRLKEGTANAVSMMLSGSQKARDGMARAGNAMQSLDRITDSASHIASLTARIAAATDEQSATAAELSRNIQQVKVIAAETADGALETSHSSQHLSELAAQLSEWLAQYQINDNVCETLPA